MLRETGERLLPDDQRGKILHAEHLDALPLRRGADVAELPFPDASFDLETEARRADRAATVRRRL